MSGDVSISIRGLAKSFGSLHVLEGVDLDVRKAENVVILGRSGSGKSVLLKLISGLFEADAGDIVVLDERVGDLKGARLDALRRRIGFSFQGSALWDSMSVFDNLAFPIEMNERKVARSEILDRVHEALASVGLSEKRDVMPSSLSGGQRKRVGIARALMLRPAVMLYDEPTSGLDPSTAGEINDLILNVQAEHHTSSLIITHDLTCARRTGDQVGMLLDGVLTPLDTFDGLFASADPRVQAFYDYNFVQGGAS